MVLFESGKIKEIDKVGVNIFAQKCLPFFVNVFPELFANIMNSWSIVVWSTAVKIESCN